MKKTVATKFYDYDLFVTYVDNKIAEIDFKTDYELSNDPILKANAQLVIDQFKEKTFSCDGLAMFNINGTSFQKSVWEALITLDYGQYLTYQELAAKVGNKKAVRAVASAVGKNPIVLLIPCHRILSKDGSVKYGPGPDKKRFLLERRY